MSPHRNFEEQWDSTGDYHVSYTTSINCNISGPVSAELHKYSPPGDTIFQDNTIAYVIAKAYIPPGSVQGNILLEAIHIAPVLGDPTSKEYEDKVLDFIQPAVFIHRTVSGNSNSEQNGIVMFPVIVLDYVCGSTMQMTIV